MPPRRSARPIAGTRQSSPNNIRGPRAPFCCIITCNVTTCGWNRFQCDVVSLCVLLLRCISCYNIAHRYCIACNDTTSRQPVQCYNVAYWLRPPYNETGLQKKRGDPVSARLPLSDIISLNRRCVQSWFLAWVLDTTPQPCYTLYVRRFVICPQLVSAYIVLATLAPTVQPSSSGISVWGRLFR
jgi:hypothetical protein